MSKGYHGLSFPFRVGVKGGLAMSNTTAFSPTHIEESIVQILNTSFDERIMEANFGSQLSTFIFEPNDDSAKNLIKYEICEALKKQESRITVLEEEIELYREIDDKGRSYLYVELPYTVNDYSNSVHTVKANLGGID